MSQGFIFLIFLEEGRRFQSLHGGSSNGTNGTFTFELDAARWTSDSRLNWGKTTWQKRKPHITETFTGTLVVGQ